MAGSPATPAPGSPAPPLDESQAPAKLREAPEDEAAAAAADSEAPDHKRKLQDLEPGEQDGAPQKKLEVSADAEAPPYAAVSENAEIKINGSGVNAPPEIAAASTEETLQGSAAAVAEPVDTVVVVASDAKVDAKPPASAGIPEGSAADGGHEVQKSEPSSVGNGQNPQHAPVECIQNAPALVPTAGEPFTPSRKMEIPNNKVGVLIGKSGNTIKYLQFNSGARIQIARDTEVDPLSSTRPVELTGTTENINKAEQLIRDVIAEADAGGSPALVARGLGTVQSGGEQIEIPVPNEKVGLIIGKGGETIKNLQSRSGARIQLIPQHLPTGDTSKDRVVRIIGNRKQMESASEMVKEVMNRAPRPYQQGFLPRGPASTPQWGPRAAAPTQQMTGYDSQSGTQYPSHATQYPQATQYLQPYGGYSQQPPPRSNINTSWDQRAAAPTQGTLQTGGYGYYGQGAPSSGVQSSNNMSAPAPASVAAAPVNYNYGQSQAPVAPGHGHPPPYSQSVPTQQSYGHGYNEPKYDQGPPSQQIYGQQASQPGVYGQQSSAPQLGYSQQQPYGKPPYGTSQEVPQGYGPPRANQPGDSMHPGQVVPSSYGQTGPPQQSYPYGSGAPLQPAPYGQSHGSTSGPVDGYSTQPQPASYPQQVQAAAGYGQGGRPVSAYTQPAPQPGGYVQQYPQSQSNYDDQAAPGSVNYGYQVGPAGPGYGNNIPSSGYAVSSIAGSQPGYAQPPPSNSSGYYEQSVPPQLGHVNMPGSAPIGYTKSLSPQPGYGVQYDSAQMYGQQ